jgi:hypothetical protein
MNFAFYKMFRNTHSYFKLFEIINFLKQCLRIFFVLILDFNSISSHLNSISSHFNSISSHFDSIKNWNHKKDLVVNKMFLLLSLPLINYLWKKAKQNVSIDSFKTWHSCYSSTRKEFRKEWCKRNKNKINYSTYKINYVNKPCQINNKMNIK